MPLAFASWLLFVAWTVASASQLNASKLIGYVVRFGNIAGCLVRSGEIRRNSKARLVRDGAIVADNLTVESLKRFKDDATEVREGYECGIGLGSFNDIKVDDVIETFEMREKARA